MTISVCTLGYGRDEHLANMLLGLRQSHRPPREVVIAVMDDARYDVPMTSFPVHQIVLGRGDIPLAKARNTAAQAARGEHLAFLDIDCIPHPALLQDYAEALQTHNGVLMGEVGYLPRGATEYGLDFAEFDRIAVRHSERPGPPDFPTRRAEDYRCFWSLNFAMHRSDFDASGGFDGSYVGYGGEDTDFGRTCADRAIPLWWVRGAKAYHQYHKHHMPPVHHLDAVLHNAGVFQDKWGEPTMQHWLRAFRLMGLAEPQNGRWVKLRDPGEAELALTRQQEHQPYASSATVLEQLEREAGLAA